MTDRRGIEIDYCPNCRGIWLDRGELDRLIKRAEQATPTHVPWRQEGDARRDDRHHDITLAATRNGASHCWVELFDF